MRFPLPLRFTIPTLVFVLGVTLGLLSFQNEIATANHRIEEDFIRRANFLGKQVGGMLEYHFGIGDLDAANRQISLLRSHENIALAFVCDDGGKILFSTDPILESRDFASVAGDIAAALKRVQGSEVNEVRLTEDKNAVLAVFPFTLGVAAGEAPHQRPGILFLKYQFGDSKRQAYHDVVGRSSAIGIILAVGSLLVWYFFHKTLTTRMARLVTATKKLATGDLSAHANLHGSDELAQLSDAFDQMAINIRWRTMELETANAKMKKEIAEKEFAENRFLSVWKSSVDGMRLTDCHGNIVAANEAFCEMIGLPFEELHNKPFTVCYAGNESAKFSDMLQKYQERFVNRSIEKIIDRQLRFWSGREAAVEVSCSFVAQDTGEPFLLSVFRDITERRQTEKLLQQQAASMQASLDGIAILDENERYIYLNEAHAKVYGYDTGEDLIGKTWETLYAAGELQRFKFDIMPVLKRSGQWRGETVGQKKDGTTFPQEISLSKIENGGLVCVVRDISARRAAEDERIALERKLLDAQKLESLGVLAGGIAHDFNNLLTAILGNASLAIMHSPENSTLRPYLFNVEKTSLQAADLCKQMLAYSGRGRFQVQRLDLNELVRDMIQLLQISVHKKVHLRIDLAGEVPAVEADPSQIRQIILNLVINASEAIGDQNGTITLSSGVVRADRSFLTETFLSPDLKAGNYVFVEVADTGCGMSAETKAKIFEPFFTTKFTGRGLGLAAVLGIVRGHEGALKVQSEPNQGSSFRFLLPCVEAPADQLNSSHSTTLSHWRGEGTILVVDDEEAVRAVASRMLESFGFHVLTARDGREGVNVFCHHSSEIKAVLLDMTMPNLNGEETLREIRLMRPDALVILMSGYSEQDATTRFIGKRLSGFMQKPFRMDELREKLRHVLKNH
jgi:PAS domain S-box-containing protein